MGEGRTSVDHDSAEDGAVPADPLCCAVRDDVCPELDGADEIPWQLQR